MAATYFRPLVLLTAILTIAQAVAWFVMSLLGVLSYRCKLEIPEESSGVQFTDLLYYLYFEGPKCGGRFNTNLDGVSIKDAVYATPEMINAWMASYLVLNITYFLLAISLFVGLCRSVNGHFSVAVLRLWCANTFAFLIMDFWLTIIWGVDFRNITDFLEDHENELNGSLAWTTSVPGALMAITARGFILYIINLILFCYFLRYCAQWNTLFSNCGGVQNGNGSQQQLYQNYPGSETDLHRIGHIQNSIPRVHTETWDRNQALVPVYVNKSHSRPHSNAVEGVTYFDDWSPQKQQRQIFWEEDTRSRSRPASPPRRPAEEIYQGRPSVRSAFEYPDRRNFEQGGNSKPIGRGYPPPKSISKNNDPFY